MRIRNDQVHYLARVIYPPRILIYGSAMMITASRFFYDGFTMPQVLLCVLLFSYPHLARVVSALPGFCTGDSIRNSLVVDGVLVGLLILGNGLQPMPSVAFLTALVISTQIVAGTRILIADLCIVLLVVLCGLPVLDEVLYRESRLLTDLLSAMSLLLYAAVVGSIGFSEMAALIGSRVKVNERRHRLEDITDRLRRYISPQLFSSLAAGGAPVITRRKRLTVFFSDIEGFTRLMDRLDEGTVTRLLNEYLTDMAAIALRHGGTVDKFMGDGVMVFFGDPVSKGPVEDAVSCVRMAIAMRNRLTALRDHWGGDLHIRIGIHTGYCAVGNFGSEDRMDYTIIGGTVNLASRLESQASRDEIVISGDTHALVAGAFRCVPKTRTRLRGIARPVTLYSVMPWHGATGAQDRNRQVIRLLD